MPALSWWTWILLVDAVLLLLTILPHLRSVAPGISARVHWLRPSLNLSDEQNLAAWWSGVLLFLGAALLGELAWSRPPAARRPWLVLGILSLGLSIDEIASVHERVSGWGGWPPIILIGLVGLGLLAWALRALAWEQGEGRSAALLALAYVCYGSIGVQEYLEHRVSWSEWAILRLGVEEGTELAGSLLVLLAAVLARGRPMDRRLRAIVPRPARLPHLGAALAAGFVVHTAVAVLLVPRLSDWHWRGHPATWYPAAVYGLAAAAAFWAWTESRRAGWWLMAGLCLAASVGAVFDLVYLLPGIERLLPRASYYGFAASYVFLVLPFLLVAFGARLLALDRRGGLLLAALALPIALRLLGGGWRVDLATPGFLALAWATALGVGRPEAGAAGPRGR